MTAVPPLAQANNSSQPLRTPKKVRPTSDKISKTVQNTITQWHSPLSKAAIETRKRKCSETLESDRPSVRKKLNYDVANLEYYEIDFDHPPINVNQKHFFELRDQLVLIEEAYLANQSDSDKQVIRKWITTIVHNKTLPHDKRMADLGALSYFLERKYSIPELQECSSFSALRAEEILYEIKTLKADYNNSFQNNRNEIPSGKTHYILRAFARMIMTERQKLNVGALYTLIDILNHTTVACHLVPEHRDHILVILNDILAKPQFKTLLETPIQIHHDLTNLIRLDLKLSRNDPVGSNQAIWACMMALFFDVRQYTGNCYAISSLVYAIENHPYKILSFMIEWLTTGHFAASDSITIPIYPLIEKRLINERDLEVELTSKDAYSLSTLQHISHVLGTSDEKSSVFGGTETLHSTLTHLQTEHTEDGVFAKQLYYAFKHNSLVEMLLTMIQFHSANLPFDPVQNNYSTIKQRFIDTLIEPFKHLCGQRLVQKMGDKIGERLWLTDHFERHVTLKDNQILVGPTHAQFVVNNFDGNLNALKVTLEDSRLIFVLENNATRSVRTISDLQTTLKDIAKELDPRGLSKLAAIIGSKKYLEKIANFCAKEIDENGVKGISGQHLLKSDLLLLASTGGHASKTLPKLFHLNIHQVEPKHASTPKAFIKELVTAFKKMDPELLATTPQLLISTINNRHSFLISPKKCALLWQDNPDPQKLLEQTIQIPTKHFYETNIPKEVVENIIGRITQNHKLKKSIRNSFNKLSTKTYDSFRTLLLDQFVTLTQTKETLMKVIDEEYSKITITATHIYSIMQKMHIQPNMPTCIAIQEEFDKKLSTFNRSGAFSFEIAAFLRKKFIEEGLSVLDPYDIERAVCEITGMPIPFDFGDLNYFDEPKENCSHSRFVARVHFGLKQMRYFCRDKHQELLDSNKSYESAVIYYPQQLTV